MPWLVELRPKTRSEVIMASKEGGNVTFREHAAVANLSTNARKREWENNADRFGKSAFSYQTLRSMIKSVIYLIHYYKDFEQRNSMF